MSQGALPAGTRVGRVALAVADLDRLTDFYADVVGLAVHDRTGERATLGTADGEPLLELHASDAPERGEEEAGLFHAAFRVPDRAALGAALERAEERWRLASASDHGVSEAIYLRDPEGNGIEVYYDTPREAWTELADGRLDIGSWPLDLDAVRSASDGTATVPAGSDVGHVNLEVSSVPAAGAFYRDTLGFRVRGSSEGDAGTLGAVESRLREAGHAVGTDGGTLTVGDPDDIELRIRAQT